MFVFTAEVWESNALRAVFGVAADSVTFYDAEEGGGRFDSAIAYDASGAEIGRVDMNAADAPDVLAEITATRCQTVKFGLDLGPQDDPAELTVGAA